MKRTALFWSLAAIAAASAAPAAAETVTLRYGHWLPPSFVFHKGVENWAKSVEAASKGTIKVKIYPAQQLGKAKDHYDMARNGIADMTWINPGYTPGQFPLIELADIPFMIKESGPGSQALNDWYAPLAEKRMKGVKLCFAHVGPPGTIHSKKAVIVPVDLKGLRVRAGSGTLARFVSANGASPVSVSAVEARQAIQRGTADAITFPWHTLQLFGVDKAVKYHLDASLYFVAAAQVMNPKVYASMSAAQKAAIDAHCNSEWAAKIGQPWVDWEREGRALLKAKKGHVFNKPDAKQLALWKDATRPILDDWKKQATKAGYDADALIAKFEAARAARGK